MSSEPRKERGRGRCKVKKDLQLTVHGGKVAWGGVA